MANGVIDFLKTKRPKDELRVALEVLREFKGHESKTEWLKTPFANWAKLEQLEEFLAHLVDGDELGVDTEKYLNWLAAQGRA